MTQSKQSDFFQRFLMSTAIPWSDKCYLYSNDISLPFNEADLLCRDISTSGEAFDRFNQDICKIFEIHEYKKFGKKEKKMSNPKPQTLTPNLHNQDYKIIFTTGK